MTLEQEFANYRKQLIKRHEYIPLASFKNKLRVPVKSDELYVPLQAMIDTRHTGNVKFADDAEAQLREHAAEEIPLSEAFKVTKESKRQGVVILGDPGSGKTTQLKRLLLFCLRQPPTELGLPADCVPVFLPLRDLGVYLAYIITC